MKRIAAKKNPTIVKEGSRGLKRLNFLRKSMWVMMKNMYLVQL